MDKNKSIDGLAPRRKVTSSPKSARASKAHSRQTAKRPNTVKRPSTNKRSTTTKSATSKSSTSHTAKPSASKPAQTQSNITADFLTPTHVFEFDEQSGELKASANQTTTNQTLTQPMKKSKKKVSKKRKIITSIILAIVIILIAGVIWLVIWGNDIIAKITGGQGNIFDLITFTEPTYEPLKTDTNGRTNILAYGTSGYNMDGDEGNGTHDGAQLTDSIMIISLNQETGDAAMISLPRDLKASPTCTATGKINEVYWCNGGSGDATLEEEAAAARALMDEVGSILDIDFQYYAHLNWGSLVSIVDILDGITVTLDEGIYDYYYTKAVFDPGVPYTINGAEALGLARARHGTTSGDFSRGASQQKILIGIKDKVLEKNLSITDLMSLASTLGDNLRTNFSIEELKTLAHLAVDLDFTNLRQISLTDLMTTGTINGISYVLPRGGAGYYTAIQDYVAKMLSNDPRSYEDYTILVLNGTDTAGLASAEQATLETAGYQNIEIGDAPASEYSEPYTLYALTDTAVGTQKLLEGQYQTTAKPSAELPADIPTDYSFILILGSTPTAAED